MNGFLKFIPYNQSQELLLPKNVQDYVPENHVARTVSCIIDHIDMWVFTKVIKTGFIKDANVI